MKTKLIIALMVFPFALLSQSASKNILKIKGLISDSATQKSIPYATISLYKMPDKTVYKRMASEIDGSFELLVKDTGSYNLAIQMIGYATYSKLFTVDDSITILDLGKIFIAESAETLNEVSIVADKPLIKVDADKISYSADVDPESKTSSVMDMLRKVPLVTVDGEDNIKLKGASNFKIFINGKPSTMLTNNAKDVLKNMPANTVKDIEVITSPGAKYDAEGIGGIINIITMKKSLNGYTCSINMGTSTRGDANSSLYFATSLGKFAFSTNLSGYYYQPPQASSETYRENYNNNDYKFTNYNGISNYKGISPWGNAEASYEIDTLNLISASLNFWYGKPEGNSENNVTVYNVNHQLVQSYTMENMFQYKYGAPEGNIDYQHIFKRNKEQLLTFSYKFSHNPENNNGETEYIPTLNYFQSMRKSSTEAFSREQTFQTDYVHPFSKKHLIELGGKYIYRQNSSFSEYYIFDYDMNQYIPEMQSNDFKYTQKIIAAYTSYNLKLEKFNVKCGLRIEKSVIDGSISSQDTSFTNKSLDLVPTVNLSYQISPIQNLKLSYNMRIQRPDIWYLNPYINKLDNKNIEFGNPNLDPEQFHNIEFNYGRFGKKSNINFTLFYSFTNNSIEDYSWMVDTVAYSSYYNLGKIWSAGFSLYGSLRFGTKFSINLNGSASYSDIKSTLNENLQNSGWGGNFNSNLQYSFAKGFKFSTYGGMYFRGVGLQSKSSSYYYAGIALSKMFFKDKFTVSVSARNPFWKEIKFTNETTDPNFYVKNINIQRARYFGINLSFRFGEMQDGVKKSKRGINNDDVKSGGGSSGGEGGSK